MSERHADWIRLFTETRASAHQTAQAEPLCFLMPRSRCEIEQHIGTEGNRLRVRLPEGSAAAIPAGYEFRLSDRFVIAAVPGLFELLGALYPAGSGPIWDRVTPPQNWGCRSPDHRESAEPARSAPTDLPAGVQRTETPAQESPQPCASSALERVEQLLRRLVALAELQARQSQRPNGDGRDRSSHDRHSLD